MLQSNMPFIYYPNNIECYKKINRACHKISIYKNTHKLSINDNVFIVS